MARATLTKIHTKAAIFPSLLEAETITPSLTKTCSEESDLSRAGADPPVEVWLDVVPAEKPKPDAPWFFDIIDAFETRTNLKCFELETNLPGRRVILVTYKVLQQRPERPAGDTHAYTIWRLQVQL